MEIDIFEILSLAKTSSENEIVQIKLKQLLKLMD